MLASVLPAVERWHDFYAMTGGAAAALVGLLFTTMALRGERAGETSAAVEGDLWAAATVPLACFLDILLLSLAFLVPDQSALGLGLPVLALAALGVALLVWVARRSFTIAALRARVTLLPSLACYLAQAAVGVAVAGDRAAPLWILAVVVGGLIADAAYFAWRLLRDPILSRAARAAPSPTGPRAPE